jgi:hypothetical protein
MARRRRSVILLLVLVSLALTAALVAPLALFSGTAELESGRAAATLRHRLAVDSLVALLPQILAGEPRLGRELDAGNGAPLALSVGDVQVTALLQDDTAKLPLPALAERGGRPAISRALGTLQACLLLPPLETEPAGETSHASAWTGCLEDLFAAPTDRALYGRVGGAAAWTRYITPLGREIQAYRADAAVLEAALADLQPGLGDKLARARSAQAKPDIQALLASLDLPEALRRAAAQRLTIQTTRYSLLVRTELPGDIRQHYLICSADDPPYLLVDWEVAR